VNSRNSSLDTPLHLACRYKMKFIINLLLNKGADVNALNRTLKHPIHELCDITSDEDPEDFEDILTTLIKYGAQLDAIDSQEHTPSDILFGHREYGESIKQAFTNVMVKTVIDLKQSLEKTKKENSLTPQIQSLLIHTSIEIKQLENLKQT
jgi:ankyrin repeat protein